MKIEDVSSIKALFVALAAAATTHWGWMGWMVVLLIICLILDYLTGTIAAGKHGKWESSKARSGIRHKLGCIVAVGVAGITDLVIGLVLSNIPVILPFKYTVVIFPVVVVWYIMTELGSILENCEKLGAPIPPFFRKAIALCKNSAEKAGEIISENELITGLEIDPDKRHS